MRLPPSIPLALIPLLSLSLACPPPQPGEDRPPEICQPAPALGAGPYFTDVTAELGLASDGLGIQGNLAASADVDNDHWPDLFLSKAVQGARDDLTAPNYNVRLLRNQAGKGFEDITFNSGFTATRDGLQGRAMQFALFGDFDNDGDTDAYSANFYGYGSTGTGDVSELMINQGDGTFALGPQTRFSDDPSYDAVVSAASLDYDHDGLLDLFVGHHYNRYGYLNTAAQDSLFAGDGAGGFADVTAAAGLQTVPAMTTADLAGGLSHRPTWGVTACDVDGDTFADLLISSYGRQWNMLFQSQGGGSYAEVGREVGFAADENLDYSDNAMYVCHCHAHGGACDPMPDPPAYSCWDDDYWSPDHDDQPFRLGGNSSNTLCGDLDNDGDLDLLQIELAHAWAGSSSDRTELLVNEGLGEGGALVRPGNDVTGLARSHVGDWNEGDLGGALLDFDNDGRLDILVASSDYAGTYSLLWHQNPDGTFTEMSNAAGLLQLRAHGVSLLDYDRDGDLDVLMGTSLMRWSSGDIPPSPGAPYAHLYRNDVGQQANRIMVHLEGSGAGGANRDGVGARIVVRAGDDIFVREHIGGHGLNGQQNDPLEIIGVGEHCTVDSVEVVWPDADKSRSSFEDVRANYVLHIRQGQALRYLTLEEYAPR